MRWRTFLVVVGLLQPAVALAQSSRVELFGGVSFWRPALDDVYDAGYVPSRVRGIHDLFREPDPRSQARQLLALRGQTGPGLGLGANLFLTPALGLQLLLDRASVTVSGTNGTHDVDLTYDTIAFPSPEPIVARSQYSFDLPPTVGRLRETTFSVNAIARFGAARRLSGNVSGGLSYFRVDLAAAEVQAFTAWLGGHAVVFSELYELAVRTTPSSQVGFNVGGGATLSVGPRLGLLIDGRYFGAAAKNAPLRLDTVRSTNVIEVPIDQIQRFLALPHLDIEPGYVRLLVGLTLKL